MISKKYFYGVLILLALITFSTTGVFAEEAAPAPAAPAWDAKFAADTVWVLVTAFLVFFMNLGFAMVESGLCRSKNAVNILSKNVIVFCVTTIFFYFVGFGIMFGSGNSIFGTSGWLLYGADNSPATGDAYKGIFASLNWTGVPLYAKFLFQLVFAGTAATIVSGAVAERIKYFSFFVFSAVMAILIYPVAGHWIWGGGWLATMKTPFLDFAGSTVVHSIGGWAALMGAILLGPRIGKYKDGRINAIPGHDMSMATLGMFVLWFGWFGFNPGSTMAADPDAISRVAINTNIAGAVGGVAATFVAYLSLGKPDLSMALNGILAGLVAITAPCNWVTPAGSFIIGLIAGVLVVYAVLFFDKIKVDDPVGALSVHLVNGVWGTLSLGLFAANVSGGITGLFYGGGAAQLISQIKGIVAVGIYVVVISLISWLVIKAVMGLRVSEDEEREGLDIGEHGMQAYPDFVGTTATRGIG